MDAHWTSYVVGGHSVKKKIFSSSAKARTCDSMVWSLTLYHLSYRGIQIIWAKSKLNKIHAFFGENPDTESRFLQKL